MGKRTIRTCARLCAIASLVILAHCSANDEIAAIPTPGANGPTASPTSGSEGAPQGEGDPGVVDPSDDGGGGAAIGDDDAMAPATDGGDAGPNKAAWFGAARCANSGLAFCDSFEGTNVDANKWTIEKNDSNTVSIDATQRARGGKALKLHFVGNTNFQYAWLSTLKPFDQVPALQTHVFGRIFYKVEKLPTKAMHWTTIEVDGLSNGGNVRLRSGGEYDNFMVNYVTGSGEMAKFSKTPFPVNQWTCIEWEYEKATNTMRLWSDEQLVSDIEVSADPKWIHPKYDKLYVGWQNYQPNLVVPMNVWVDEVAVDATRIGCSK